MAKVIEYALMAGASYKDTRADINRFPIPIGWTLVSRNPQDNITGFEASVFGNATTLATSTEIVISYAGTYDKDIFGDIVADIGLATGFGSSQLLQAAEYYLDIRRQNQAADISLTGHSLGGGLAALVGVFFGVPAFTFDQALFALSAENGLLNILAPDVATNLKTDLLANGYTENELTGLTNFLQQRDANGGIPNTGLITDINVQGEFLSVAPLTLFDRIGAETVIPNAANGVSGIDL